MTEAKKTDAEAAEKYARGVWAGQSGVRFADIDCSIEDFLAGCAHKEKELRDAKIAAARRGAEVMKAMLDIPFAHYDPKITVESVVAVVIKELDNE